MRIVGGQFKGRAITTPASRHTRPTSDRTREAIFNILEHGIDNFSLEGARILDLFAGTGALGLEALSRGGRFAQFIDDDTNARSLIRHNADALGVIGQVKIWRRDATKLGVCTPQKPYDLIFLDPPYNKALADKTLSEVIKGNWLAAHGVVMVEEAQTVQLSLPDNLGQISHRVYGDTQIVFLRHG